ncbi:hypothetical protein M413DRAFT_446782, partial [Hebeloma cylindrosporum]
MEWTLLRGVGSWRAFHNGYVSRCRIGRSLVAASRTALQDQPAEVAGMWLGRRSSDIDSWKFGTWDLHYTQIIPWPSDRIHFLMAFSLVTLNRTGISSFQTASSVHTRD